MILAARRGVKRVLWLIFGGLALLAAAVLFQSGPAGDALARVEPAPPPPVLPEPSVLPDVQVRHEFVEIPLAPPPRRTSLARRSEGSAPAAAKKPLAPPLATARPDVVRTADTDNLLVRAGRALIGDGKHRPEPFPRIKTP
jgi:hypothetical protein